MVFQSCVLDNRYKIIKEIKSGGFGIVYYGWDLDLDRPIALKEIHPNLFSDARFVDMFQDEAINTAKLNHPNIVHIYSLRKSTDGRFFIVMEYIEGVDLRHILTKCREIKTNLPTAIACNIIQEASRALDYAHGFKDMKTGKSLDLIHRDVSPSNIMVTMDGDIKLIDFGIARAKSRRTEKTRAGELKGKIAYMSPEQAKGREDIDFRSDIFSLGVVFFELLTMRRLFDNESELGLLRDVSRVRFSKERLESLIADPALIKIVEKCVEKERENRFQSANDIVMSIAGFMRSLDATHIRHDVRDFIKRIYFEDEIITAEKIAETKDEEDEGESRIIETKHLFRETPSGKVDDGSDNRAAQTLSIQSNAQAKSERESGALHSSEEPGPKILSAVSREPRQAEEEPKTMIDVIRLSARAHKKELILGGIILVSTFFIFLVMDSVFRWTGMGKAIYDLFLPPTLYLKTVPGGATVLFGDTEYIADDQVRIPKIKPGNYSIRASLDGFRDIEKTVYVESKGASIEGETIKQEYILSFQAPILFESEPEGARIFLNGEEYLDKRTPCSIDWYISRVCEIKLVKEGYEPLTDIRIDLEKEKADITDNRWCVFQQGGDTEKTYRVKGTFWKSITLQSLPSGAEVYIDGGTQSAFLTRQQKSVKLGAGPHRIILKKRGYIDDAFDLVVDEHTGGIRRRNLYRNVRLKAYSAANPDGGDLNARLVKEGPRNRLREVTATRTPLTRRIPPWNTYVLLKAVGHRDTTDVIRPNEWEKEVYMTKQQPLLIIKVTDTRTVTKDQNVRVHYRCTKRSGASVSEPWRYTTMDISGSFMKRLESGTYAFRFLHDGFYELNHQFEVKEGEDNFYFIKFIPLRQEEAEIKEEEAVKMLPGNEKHRKSSWMIRP